MFPFSNKFTSISILIILLEYWYFEGVAGAKPCKSGEVWISADDPSSETECKENSCLENVDTRKKECSNRCVCNNWLYRGFNNECIPLDQCVESYSTHLKSIEQYKKETPLTSQYFLKVPTAHTVHVLCYDDLGCFDKHRICDRLPYTPEKIKATISYFAKRRLFEKLPVNGTVPLYPPPSKFVPNQFVSRIFCISHGFRGAYNDTIYLELRDLMLRNKYIDLVLVLDWGQSTSSLLEYDDATANTEMVGRQMGLILSQWRKHSRITSHSIHLWGFSLGSHVMNTAAMFYTEKTNEKVRRLSLIDAADPNFDNIVLRPTSEAAQFVEAYHTSGGQFGISGTMGHIDFFINGGSSQPGCFWESLKGDVQCSHNAATAFFKTSFDCDAKSIRCDSYDVYKDNINKGCDFDDLSTLGVKSEISTGRGRHYIATTYYNNLCDLKIEHKKMLATTITRTNPYLKTKKHKLFG